MTRRVRRVLAAVLVVGGAVGFEYDTAAQAPANARRYRIIDIGTLGGEFSRARAVNNRGEVAGESLLPDNADVQAFHWNGGVMRQLTPYQPGSLGSSSGAAINDHGVVVGHWDPSGFPNTPPVRIFRYDATADDVAFLADGRAQDINNAGQILAVGPGGRDFIIGGVDLDAAFGGGGVNSSAINQAGDVVVTGSLVGQGSFIYRQGQFLPVTGFGASAINDVGQVAGSYLVDLGFNGLRSRVAMQDAAGVVRTFTSLHPLGNARANAINNHGTIVGTEVVGSGGQRISTAFVIENGVTRRLSDLLPPNSGWTFAGDFGEANDINDRGEIVGTGLINGEWHAYLLTPELCTAADDVDQSGNPDNDGDGLCDSWEVNGIDVDRDGEIDFTFPDDVGIGTNLNQKDMLVEYDWMDCQVGPSTCAGSAHDHRPLGLSEVLFRFEDATTLNPDGTHGVHLWLIDSEPVPHIETALFRDDGTQSLDDFNDIKLGDRSVPCDGFLSHPSLRAHADCEKKLEAWGMAVRYGIFGHNHAHPVHSSGIAERPGNDFMVTLGGWSAAELAAVGGREEAENATLMHELGHTLGLDHGGGDSINCKPNYISVMNHALMFKYIHPHRPLNFNGIAFAPLDELRLSDAPLVAVDGSLVSLPTVFGLGGAYAVVADVADPIDWRVDGIDPPGVQFSQDINMLPGLCEADSIDVGVSGDPARDGGRLAILEGFSDWANIQLPFRLTADFVDGASRITPSAAPEITGALARTIAEQLDFDGDAVPNFPDNCPAVANPAQDDADGDGIGNACEANPPDTTPPTLTLPQSMTVETTDPSGAKVDFTVTAADAVNGPVPVACNPSSGSTFPFGTTKVTCSAADAAGNSSSGSFDITIVSRPSSGRMFGLGFTNDAPVRYVFAFVVEETSAGHEGGWLSFLAERPASGRGLHLPRIDRFIATAITSVTFADDPSYRPAKSVGPNLDTVSFSGIGTWNGKKGYRFEARASDRGEPGRHADTLDIVVTAPSGAVVARVDGPIAGGNIQSSR